MWSEQRTIIQEVHPPRLTGRRRRCFNDIGIDSCRMTIFPFRNMLISLQRHTHILRATVFVAALLLCFLPSLEEITFAQDLSPVALPSDMFVDGEERDSGDPLHHSVSSHNDALSQQLVSSLQRVAPSRS